MEPVPPHQRRALGERLVEAGLLDPGDLAKALALQQRQDSRIGEILSGHGMVPEARVREELARQAGLHQHQGETLQIASELRRDVTARDCLLYGFAPLQRLQNGTLVAVADPNAMDTVRRKLPEHFGVLHFVLVERETLQDLIARAFPTSLTLQAETLTEASQSCRSGLPKPQKFVFFTVIFTILAATVLMPAVTLRAVLVVGFLAMAATIVLKFACLVAGVTRPREKTGSQAAIRLPKISILVPLYQESEIANTLLRRLKKISYPSELLDILLVLEADDEITQETLTRTRLPRHMRAVEVPEGTLKTNPRALNYALDFTEGEIVGVYDAEDAPAPDQLHKVAQTFAQGGHDLACVQGVLSFYNWSRNWMSRCFFFEYAGWFRLVLPGLSRLGMAIPLGGTTLFFRRAALLDLGGWDAHNVTEDADLGIRLARFGYRTQMIDTVTEEEANCRVWPWIRQRSRWLKGYAVTWAVHMRSPRTLWRDLGTKRFMGFQVLFLGTLASFFLAPVFWITSGLMMSGVLTPAQIGLRHEDIMIAGVLFLGGEVLNLLIYWGATRRIKRRPTLLWTLTLPAYFVFASMAAYKAFFELWRNPFYWDKTAHGAFGGLTEDDAEDEALNVVEFAGVDLEADFESDREVVAQRL